MDVEDHNVCVVSCDGFRVLGCKVEQLSDCLGGCFCAVSFFYGDAVQGH